MMQLNVPIPVDQPRNHVEDFTFTKLPRKYFRVELTNKEVYIGGAEFTKLFHIKGPYKALGPACKGVIYLELAPLAVMAFNPKVFQVTEVTKEQAQHEYQGSTSQRRIKKSSWSSN